MAGHVESAVTGKRMPVARQRQQPMGVAALGRIDAVAAAMLVSTGVFVE